MKLRLVALPVVLLAILVSASGGLSTTASNTVTAGRVSRTTAAITPATLAPSVCSSIAAGLTTLRVGVNGNNSNELILSNGTGLTLSGSGGTDCMVGGAGVDTLSGGNGNDVIYGRAGNDVLNGDANNDTLLGGAGTDTLTGGAATDSCDRGTDGLGTFATCETSTSVGPD
ncbi:MAG: hypothetical protein EPO65_13820 [Dehalococcoidia bacterium]|nr:MAG: hypothetical protein EPO65_13820 [Dehalococcoidia bacterium]